MRTKPTRADQDGAASHDSGLDQPQRNTPYTTISVTPGQRNKIRTLRDELGYGSYGALFDDLIENAQEDTSTQ